MGARLVGGQDRGALAVNLTPELDLRGDLFMVMRCVYKLLVTC